jgi:hypothetical protein
MTRFKKIRRWLLLLVALFVLFFSAVVVALYAKQDAIVQELLVKANADFVGQVSLKGSHISLFKISRTSRSIWRSLN